MTFSRGWRYVVLAIALFAAAIPFAFVTIAPLVDAPGHLGQFAIQTAAPSNPLRFYFDFHWSIQLNLATDLLIEPLRRVFGLIPAFWLITATIPVLTVLAALVLASKVNPGRAGAASWGLPFAYSYPFLYGFLNFSLTMALSFLAYALWDRLAQKPALRERLFWLVVPALMICHAIGGGLLPAMIGAAAVGAHFPNLASLRDPCARRAFLREVRPLLAIVPLIVIWRLGQSGSSGDTFYSMIDKLSAVALALRDQHHWFDIACVGGVIAVWIGGFFLGARLSRPHGCIVLILAVLFVATPSELSGAYFSDMRLVPPLAIAALTLQDWSGVAPRITRTVVALGAMLFLARMAIVAISFAGYERSYAAEAGALPHIAPGSRVIALVTRRCKASLSWRMDRLDHFPALATVTRGAWVNVHWDVGDIHLLKIRYRPSIRFYNDPSQYVWPSSCQANQTVPRTDEEERNMRHTIGEVLPLVPLDRVNYLWLVHASLPNGPWRAGLQRIWSNGQSTLYRITPPVPSSVKNGRRA